MRFTTNFMVILITVLMFSATGAVAETEVFRWVDKNGVVHFGDRADGQPDATKVDIKTAPSGSDQPNSVPVSPDTDSSQEPAVSYAQQRRDERSQKRKEAAKEQAELTAKCKQMRQFVTTFEPRRVLVENEDGTTSMMDDDERIKQVRESKAFIAGNCKP